MQKLQTGPLGRWIWVVFGILMVLSLGAEEGCGGALTEPTVVSMSIEPSTISLGETGMTDEFLTATLLVSNFSAEPTEAEIFIQDPERVANAGEVTIQGDQIVLSRIAKTLFQGLEPGVYTFGATVTSPNENITVLDLATVTVTQ